LLAEARAEEPTKAAAILRDALGLFRGRPLAEFADERFAEVEVARIEALRLEALEERIEGDLALGRHAALVGELEALVAAEPLRERLRAQLMVALYRCGRQAEALAAYREGRRVLVEELGIEPGRPLQELEQAVLRQDPTLELRSVAAVIPPDRAEPEQQVAAPRALPEERELVSILVVDLGGFTAPNVADPEDVRAALQPAHAAAKSEIERHGGTVERLVGDALMSVFGAPVAHEDDPERAVRAALAIRQWLRAETDDLQGRIAVNTGVALVPVDGRPREGEAIAAGDVVNTAQRILAGTSVDGILVGEQTYRATRDAIEYRAVAPVEARGESEPIPAWEALEAHSAPGVSVRHEPGAPLVGRQRELDLLVSALARVREERSPQLVTLVGVPGIGKSRLVFELSKIVGQDREPLTWCQGRCLPYGDGVSFWALGEAVKAQVGILESDGPAQAEVKLRSAVVELVSETKEARWVEEQLRPLVGVTGERGSVERAGEASPAWRRFFSGLADLRPLVLVLEDLHWADEGLLDFVDELADRIRDAPLLVLCTVRPELLERRPGWGGGKANALTISLPPLSDDETGRVFAAVLEQPMPEADVHEALIARAGGNPLYAEQFARVLTEIGSLEELPETVHGIIAARLDGLASAEKALLQDAAVVGKVFWLGAIEAIGDTSRQRAEELLFGLERKEFVQQARRSSVAGEAEYSFRHVLLRDVAYGQIPRAARGERHNRAASWIESLGRAEDHAEMLAHHYLNALEYAKATGRAEPALADRARLALRAAGDHALALASYAAAARFYNGALEVWPESDPDRVWLLVNAGRASHAADGSGIELLEGGFEELRSLGDADGAAEVAVELARRSFIAGERDAAYAWIDRALELAKGRGHSGARAHALVERAAYHLSASEHLQAIRLAREALLLTEALGMDDLQVRALDVLGASRAVSGDVGGLEDSKRAIALARERNAFSRLIVAERNLHFSQFFLGHLAAAWEALSMYRRDVESYGSAHQRRSSRGAEAHEAVLHGRWDEAALMLDEVVAETEAEAAYYEDPMWRVLRASIALARGDLEGASAGSDKALNRARKMKDAQVLAPALAFRGIVLLEEGRPEEASKLASELLGRGSVLVPALTTVHPPVTLIEFAWLLRDLGRDAELLSVLASAPSTPWCHAARAIARGDMADGVELSARIGAPSVEAYTRLRAAQELARAGHRAEARDCLAPALAFFGKVGATRYLAQAEQVLAPSA
jgi:class 3 adenylate cyclase